MKALLQKILYSIKLKAKKQLGKIPPKLLYPAHLQDRKPPFNYQEQDSDYFAHEFAQNICETRLHEIDNASVHANHGVVFKGFSVLLDSSVLSSQVHRHFNFYHYLFLQIKGKKIKLDTNERYLVATNMWAHGFFHWILDTLPRLYAVKDLTKDLIFILPKSYEENDIKKGWTPFYLESLLPFQFKAILEVEENALLSVPHLVVPSHTAESGNYNAEIIKGMRNMYHKFFVNQAKEPPLNLGNKIYITRQKAFWRKVKNDNVVIPILESYGFRAINLEDYTFSQKVQIAYHAKYVTGIFSSGQTVAAFMQAGSFLLDLRPKDTHNLAIYSLCDAIDVHYLYQFCEYVDVEEERIAGNVASQSFNLYIDTEELHKNIKKMLNFAPAI